MIVGIIAALAGHLSNAFAALADKYLLKRAFQEPTAYVFWIGLISMLVFVLLPFDFGYPATAAQWFTDLLAGALFSAALYFYFTAVKQSELSSVVPVVGSLSAIITAVVAYGYLQERLSLMQILAIGVLLVGFWVLAYEGGGLSKAAIKPSVLAALLFALSSIAMKVIFFNQPFIPGLVFSRLGGLAVSVALFASPAVRSAIFASVPRFGTRNVVVLIADHLAGALGFVLLNLGISLSSPTIVNALQGVQYAFLYIFVGIARPFAPEVFKEDRGRIALRRKFTGIAIIVIGIAMMAWG